MTINQSLSARMESECSRLRDAEQKVVRWVLANSDAVLRMSIAQLAKSCNVSESTIIRTCQTLGFSGYRDFRVALAMDVASSADQTALKNLEEIHTEDDLETIMKKIFTVYQQAMQTTMENFDVPAFVRAIDIILYANRLEVFAGGTQSAIAQYASSRFIGTGISCIARLESVDQLRAATVMKPSDVLLIFNHSGCLKTLVQSAELARAQGAIVIAVTSFPDSPLAKTADIILVTGGKDMVIYSRSMRYQGMTSKVVQIALIDCLVLGITMRCPDVVIPNMVSISRISNLIKEGLVEGMGHDIHR